MHAAVVTTFDPAPRYGVRTSLPVTTKCSSMSSLAGLHPRVRSQADGSHYTSTDELPLVPGIDGVGRGQDGLLRYFVLPDTTMGAMAERPSSTSGAALCCLKPSTRSRSPRR